MIYLELFLGFLKVGLFSFGGAYAAIPLIQDTVIQYGWMDKDMLTYMVAVSESTPGPIMINLATYVGTTKGGILGALAATVAVALPAFIIMLILSSILTKALSNKHFDAVLSGLIPCISAIIFAFGLTMITENIRINKSFMIDYTNLGLAAILMAIYWGFRKLPKIKITPIMLILISAILGIVIY